MGKNEKVVFRIFMKTAQVNKTLDRQVKARPKARPTWRAGFGGGGGRGVVWVPRERSLLVSEKNGWAGLRDLRGGDVGGRRPAAIVVGCNATAVWKWGVLRSMSVRHIQYTAVARSHRRTPWARKPLPRRRNELSFGPVYQDKSTFTPTPSQRARAAMTRHARPTTALARRVRVSARTLLTIPPDGLKSPLGYPARHIDHHLLGAHAHMTTMTQPWTTAAAATMTMTQPWTMAAATTTARRHRHDDDGGDVRRGTAHARRAVRCCAPRQGACASPLPRPQRALSRARMCESSTTPAWDDDDGDDDDDGEDDDGDGGAMMVR
ncbi:hypothetical protein EDB84DRAFT_1681158 [Lactarius hengduanensis]|nr:hypothetical protein EDB84DRAFT_1681158 [Lactarius hengduanensis]